MTNTERATAIDRVSIGQDAEGLPTITVRDDRGDRIAGRIIEYVGRHAIRFEELAQSIYFPADDADRRRRGHIAAIVRRG